MNKIHRFIGLLVSASAIKDNQVNDGRVGSNIVAVGILAIVYGVGSLWLLSFYNDSLYEFLMIYKQAINVYVPAVIMFGLVILYFRKSVLSELVQEFNNLSDKEKIVWRNFSRIFPLVGLGTTFLITGFSYAIYL